MKLTGHKVLVTGGGSGIGLALARAFLDRGNSVAICGRNAEVLARVSRECPGLLPIRCDVSEEDQLRQMAEKIESEFGGLSILANNAGIQVNCVLGQEPTEAAFRSIDSEIGINLAAVAKATVLFLPLLMREREAAVVNVSSGLALVPKKSAAVYCATKAAVHSFSRALRWQMEDAGTRVRVFEVLPPLVDTAMTAGRGAGKLSPEQVAVAALRGMERNQWEIRVGKVRLLGWIDRALPRLAERIMRNA